VKRKWLLDHNLPRQLAILLIKAGIDSHWTSSEGWEKLSNGDLVKSAVAAGYQCLLTSDRKFAISAGNALTRNPGFSVVEITLAQAPKRQFLALFERAWSENQIHPLPGRVVEWPHGKKPKWRKT
jgi:predicted nuclease of predicted toxin-antitoxin system